MADNSSNSWISYLTLLIDCCSNKVISYFELALQLCQRMLFLCHYGLLCLWKNGKIENLNFNSFGTCINSNNKNPNE